MQSNCNENCCSNCIYWSEVSEDIYNMKLIMKGVCKYPYREMTRYEYEECDYWEEELSYS